MSQISRYEPQRTAPASVDNRRSSNSLFPPYYPERTSSLPRSNSSEAEQRRNSQASNTISSQTLPGEVEEEGGGGGGEESAKAKRRSIWQRYYHFLLVVLPRGWSIEYISCFISVAAFVSLMVVLNQYDNKRMPSWPLDITLNTLLALLTAVSQTCFVYPVVQGISQMKWN
ncbi:hypothetical protein UA08_09378 [Talaromyces atroroseus]|uniref:Uncharacterized protein n=1 Tax=Talaromyces atroroseus TaxID=1441469 RepID=A0A1Q5Q673_TALAT|nr:hypothetical protein UA08_09378 [Talaromyces atroroseus]OKL55369.1 hypothetical protein UA08_09378 [Talaromyces atroroseus]